MAFFPKPRKDFRAVLLFGFPRLELRQSVHPIHPLKNRPEIFPDIRADRSQFRSSSSTPRNRIRRSRFRFSEKIFVRKQNRKSRRYFRDRSLLFHDLPDEDAARFSPPHPKTEKPPEHFDKPVRSQTCWHSSR